MRDKLEPSRDADSAGSKSAASRPRSTSRSSTGSRSKYTNTSLPHGIGTAADRRWRNVFCHSFFEYMGTADDPWSVEPSYIQDVWDVVYPDLCYPEDEDELAALSSIVSGVIMCVSN